MNNVTYLERLEPEIYETIDESSKNKERQAMKTCKNDVEEQYEKSPVVNFKSNVLSYKETCIRWIQGNKEKGSRPWLPWVASMSFLFIVIITLSGQSFINQVSVSFISRNLHCGFKTPRKL